MKARKQDALLEELIDVLSRKRPLEFKPLFEIVYAKLLARKAVNGGEEMLRLRAHEKVHHLVRQGAVIKMGKEFVGVSSRLVTLKLEAKEHRSHVAKRHVRP